MNWPVLLSAFTFIFLAALPGRTTFVMLLMAARERPIGVFIGAALAFAVQSLISVCLGQALAYLPVSWVRLAAGVLFLYFAKVFWQDSHQEIEATLLISETQRGSLPAIIRMSFIMIFAAEWGDVSQIAIASTAAQYHDNITVFISAVLALWLIAGVAVGIGAHTHKVLKPWLAQRFASFVFAAIGVYFIANALGSL